MTSTTEKLSAVIQEITDFKEETFKRLQRIEMQTTKTNGRVGVNEQSIALIRQGQENCPAKIYHMTEPKDKILTRNWTVFAFIIMLIINITVIIINIGGG